PSAIRAAEAWDTPLAPHVPERDTGATLFDLEAGSERSGGVPQDIDEALAECSRHRVASEGSGDPRRRRAVAAADAAGALRAAVPHEAGIPWDEAEHDRILQGALGPRPGRDQVPARRAEAAAAVREALGDPTLQLESDPRLLRALHPAGVDVDSTSQWELEEHDTSE